MAVDTQPAAAARHRAGSQHVPGEVGIWILVFGDLVIFGLLFIVFVHERSRNVALFEEAHATVSLGSGAVNTLLLLTGSMFVVLGVDALRRNKQRRGRQMLLLTLLCGAVFVVNKYFEYSTKLEADQTPEANPFYMYYFVLSGIHLVHVLFGMTFLTIVYRVARKPVLASKDIATIEAGGIVWHLVDLLWIVLFALLYVMR